jgi:beta-glucanase (GH16 family)
MAWMIAVAMLAVVACAPPANAASYAPLVWSDEFDGNSIDPVRWAHRASGPRSDGHLTPDAVSVADGILTIKTYTEGGRHYSGMIGTQPQPGFAGFEQQYGYFEARVRFDSSPGMWSAFWLQSPTIGVPIGSPEPAGVEMDIAEHRASCPAAATIVSAPTCRHGQDISNRAQRALIWDGYAELRKVLVKLSEPLPGLGNGSWHTWAMRWSARDVTFYFDGAPIGSASAPTSPISQRSQYLILSSEVGEFFAGAIPAAGYGSRETTTTSMQVDYVRVWATGPAGTAVPMGAVQRDLTAPRTRVFGRPRQQVGRPVGVTIACLDEDCRATATGSVRVPRVGRSSARTYTLKPATTTITKGTRARVRLRLSGLARLAIVRALIARKRIVMRLGVRVTDHAGNSGARTHRVVLRR